MKAKKVSFIPKGYNVVTPYLCVNGAAAAIAFYKKIFGAIEVMRMAGPNGTIGHAEIAIDNCRLMLADEFPDMNFRGPRSFGGHFRTPTSLCPRRGQNRKKGLAAGAKVVRPVTDQFYGDRSGSLEDPFGHVWHVATHKEDIPTKELKKRAAAMAASSEKQ